MLSLFASCLPGLEPLLRRELAALGLEELAETRGGIAFTGGSDQIYRANLCSGLASHVLLRIAEFPCKHLAQLRRKADQLPWRDLFGPGQRFAVRATTRRAKLYHSGAVAERIAAAVAQATGAQLAESPRADDLVVHVRVHKDVVTLSIDTSGTPLHRRGWRLQTAKAPLREDLARALLLASGWAPRTPLVDPMTGSGTIAVEAATLARNLPPGRGRSFAFEKMPLCDADQLAALRADLDARASATAPAPIHASDRDRGAIEAAQANAERAGVRADIEFATAPLRGAAYLSGRPAPPAAGALVCNPPYGRRLGRSDKLVALYQSLGHAASQLAGWRVGLCAADRRLALRSGLELETGFLTGHGGLKVRALVGQIAGESAAS